MKTSQTPRNVDTESPIFYCPAELSVPILKLYAVCNLAVESGGDDALERCGADTKTGFFDLVSDLASEIHAALVQCNEEAATASKGGAA